MDKHNIEASIEVSGTTYRKLIYKWQGFASFILKIQTIGI